MTTKSKSTTVTMKKVNKKIYFNEKTGFVPNTPKKEIVKHFAKIIAKKKLSDIFVNYNYVIAIKIPVWPVRIQGVEIKYYKDAKTGEWKYSHKSGLLLKMESDLRYNNIPNIEKFRGDDFDDHAFQFLVVASESDRVLPGTIAHTRPEVKSIGFFNFRGVEMVMLNSQSVMFTEEV